MRKYTLLVLALCVALLAGCGMFDDSAPTNTPGSSSQSTADPTPTESEPSSGITPEPPDMADRKPVESREPAVFVEPDETDSQPSQGTSESEKETVPVPSPDIENVPVRVDAEFCGEWFAREADSTGEIRALELILEEDGTAYFSYGVPYREVLEVFEGRWREEGGNLVLDLYGGPVADDGSYEYDYCRDIDVSFRWEEQGIALICEHVGGNPLMPGTSGEWFTFRPFDSFLLSGTWYADGGYGLELSENGSCMYRITDKSGSLLAEYDGWWNYRSGQIMLSVNMCGGSRYEAGERGQIAGTYKEEYSSQSEMRLALVSGSALTEAMESGSVTFKKR